MIQRKLREFGTEFNCFSEITNGDLDDLVKGIVTRLPACGKRSIHTLYKVNGMILQRERVRESIRRVDLLGLETRLRSTLHHQQYNIASPNALWHIDGYHKLIRWQVVIHGGIDGYSQVPVYLKVASNNSCECFKCIYARCRVLWITILCTFGLWRRKCPFWMLHAGAFRERSRERKVHLW